MKVYIVNDQCTYDYEGIDAVFSTFEKAKAYLGVRYHNENDVEEIEIDAKDGESYVYDWSVCIDMKSGAEMSCQHNAPGSTLRKKDRDVFATPFDRLVGSYSKISYADALAAAQEFRTKILQERSQENA